jgi:tRNA-dihydrouridine synthase
MKIGSVTLPSPYVVAPMAGMTDTAFRRLVRRQGGCGLVVTEMVSSEGLVRGIGRTLEYAEYTEEERPVSIQIFGGDPAKMAAAAQIVEGMGADIVDVNMGCPVPKIAKHHAGCSLMREPAHAASVIAAMSKAVKIPVTVKMRAGWNDHERNALELARGVLRNPWILAQAADIAAGRPPRQVTLHERGQFLCDYIELLLNERVDEGEGFRHFAPCSSVDSPAGTAAGNTVGNTVARGRDRWVINKVRALCAWYSKGLDDGSHLRLRVNSALSLGELRDIVDEFFFAPPPFTSDRDAVRQRGLPA